MMGGYYLTVALLTGALLLSAVMPHHLKLHLDSHKFPAEDGPHKTITVHASIVARHIDSVKYSISPGHQKVFLRNSNGNSTHPSVIPYRWKNSSTPCADGINREFTESFNLDVNRCLGEDHRISVTSSVYIDDIVQEHNGVDYMTIEDVHGDVGIALDGKMLPCNSTEPNLAIAKMITCESRGFYPKEPNLTLKINDINMNIPATKVNTSCLYGSTISYHSTDVGSVRKAVCMSKDSTSCFVVTGSPYGVVGRDSYTEEWNVIKDNVVLATTLPSSSTTDPQLPAIVIMALAVVIPVIALVVVAAIVAVIFTCKQKQRHSVADMAIRDQKIEEMQRLLEKRRKEEHHFIEIRKRGEKRLREKSRKKDEVKKTWTKVLSDSDIAVVAKTISPSNIQQLATEHFNMKSYELDCIRKHTIHDAIVDTITCWNAQNIHQTNNVDRFSRLLYAAYKDRVIDEPTSRMLARRSGNFTKDILHDIGKKFPTDQWIVFSPQYLNIRVSDEMTKHTEESSDKLAISILKEWRSKNGENATVKRLLKVFEIARQNRHLNWETINALEDRIELTADLGLSYTIEDLNTIVNHLQITRVGNTIHNNLAEELATQYFNFTNNQLSEAYCHDSLIYKIQTLLGHWRDKTLAKLDDLQHLLESAYHEGDINIGTLNAIEESHGEITQNDINRVANTISYEQWINLYPRLNLKKKLINHVYAVADAKGASSELSSISVLLVWRNTNYEEATVSRLLEILEVARKDNPQYRWAVNEIRENIGVHDDLDEPYSFTKRGEMSEIVNDYQIICVSTNFPHESVRQFSKKYLHFSERDIVNAVQPNILIDNVLKTLKNWSKKDENNVEKLKALFHRATQNGVICFRTAKLLENETGPLTHRHMVSIATTITSLQWSTFVTQYMCSFLRDSHQTLIQEKEDDIQSTIGIFKTWRKKCFSTSTVQSLLNILDRARNDGDIGNEPIEALKNAIELSGRSSIDDKRQFYINEMNENKNIIQQSLAETALPIIRNHNAEVIKKWKELQSDQSCTAEAFKDILEQGRLSGHLHRDTVNVMNNKKGELLDDDIRSIADSITEEHFSVIYGHFHINNNSVEVSQIQRCGDRVITTFTKFFDLWYRTIYDTKTLRRLKRVLQFSAKDKDINKSIIDAWSKILDYGHLRDEVFNSRKHARRKSSP